MIRPELLAPAGSMDALHAAVDNGANAVYVGVGSLNARANAQNFDIDDLKTAVSYAHLRSVRVYLALNILLRDDELTPALILAREAYELGVDALIIQDIGLMRLLMREYPYIPLHASTQLNLFDSEAVQWAKENNFSRIILPRELSIFEIGSRTKTAAEIGLEVEVFIHGALCVCYSGLCLFSAMNGNGQRSGNRGLCAQPCRTMYNLKDNYGEESSEGRLLSVKDQSALLYIRQLIEAGVHSLKIEGRMKDSSYVASVVRAYREYIDIVFRKEESAAAESKIQQHLLLAFNRGGSFAAQYMQGKKNENLPAGRYSGRFGLLIGVVVKKNARAGTLSLRLSNDTLPIRGDYLSIRVKEEEVSSFPIGKLEKMGDLLVVMGLHPQMIEKIPDGANVFQMSELSYTRDLLQGKSAYKTPIVISLHFEKGISSNVALQLFVAEGMWKGTRVSVSMPADLDMSYPELSHDRISEQLSKTKSSPFVVQNIEYEQMLDLHAPVSLVNELRRKGLLALEKNILSQKHPPLSSAGLAAPNPSLLPGNRYSCNSSAKCGDEMITVPVQDDIIHVNYFDLRRILPQKLAVRANYYSFSVYDLSDDQVHKALTLLHDEEPQAKYLIWLPGAYKDLLLPLIDRSIQYMKKEFLDSYAGVVTSTPRKTAEPAWINGSSNLHNHAAMCEALCAGAAAVAPSYELKDQNMTYLLSEIPRQYFNSAYLSLHRYGRIEWMQSEFCPVGRHEDACTKCKDSNQNYSLQMLSHEDSASKKGKELPVITHSASCTAQILGPLHPSVGENLLQYCKDKGIAVAHTVRYLDEPYDIRVRVADEILISQ